MKKTSLVLSLVFLLVTVSACAGNAPVNEDDAVATIVAGTLSAAVVPANVEATQTSLPAANTLTLNDFPNKELLGENETYAIYLINPVDEDGGKAGEIVVHNKKASLVTKMNGTFKIFGSAIVFDDGRGDYVLLSTGTYTSRTAIVLSLVEQKQAVGDFCITSGEVLFWNSFILFNNCDAQPNRPWGAGEAASINAINLKTGTKTVIAQSDLSRQYAVLQIDGNTLLYTETYVEKEEDWQLPDNHKTNEGTYDLNLLGNN